MNLFFSGFLQRVPKGNNVKLILDLFSKYLYNLTGTYKKITLTKKYLHLSIDFYFFLVFSFTSFNLPRSSFSLFLFFSSFSFFKKVCFSHQLPFVLFFFNTFFHFLFLNLIKILNFYRFLFIDKCPVTNVFIILRVSSLLFHVFLVLVSLKDNMRLRLIVTFEIETSPFSGAINFRKNIWINILKNIFI